MEVTATMTCDWREDVSSVEGLLKEVCDELIEVAPGVASRQAVCLVCVDLHK